MPSFKELYAQVEQEGRVSLTRSPFLPICKNCGKNIFDELEHLKYEVIELKNVQVAPNLTFFISFLLDTDDLTKLLCYREYNDTVAKRYEPKKRADILAKQSDAGNYTKYQQLNIPRRFWGHTLSKREEYPHQEQINKVAQDYIAGGYKDSLLLSSLQRGFGKTELATDLLIQYWIDNGGGTTGSYWKDDWACLNSNILFLNETDLYFMIRSTYSQNALYSEFDIYKQLTQRVEMLVIDDLFFVGDKTFMRSVLSRLIHKRCDEEMLPIILTSNCTLPMLTNIDRSLASRLARGRYVSTDPKIKAPDLRTIYK